MNKVYKVIWSKAKNCYVVASELVKAHTKSPKTSVISRTLAVSVLSSFLSFCSFTNPVFSMELVGDISIGSSVGNAFSVLTNQNSINEIASFAGLTDTSSLNSLVFTLGQEFDGQFCFFTYVPVDNTFKYVKLSYAEALNYGIVNNKGLSTYSYQLQDNLSSINYGSGAKATYNNSVALGIDATAGNEDTVAIGNNARAFSEGAVAIGGYALANGGNSDYYATAVGYGAYVGDDTHSFEKGTALGGSATVNASYGTAVGASTYASSEYGTAVGANSEVASSKGTAIGYNAYVDYGGAPNSIALGADSTADEANILSIGHGLAGDEDEITRRIVHVTAGVEDTDAVNVKQMNDAIALGTGSLIHNIGVNGESDSSTNYNGQGAVGNEAIAIGSDAVATGEGALALMKGAKGTEYQTIAIGVESEAIGGDSIAIGTEAKTADGSSSSIAIGNGAVANGEIDVVIGGATVATGNGAVVIGKGSASMGTQSYGAVVIGVDSNTSNGIAIGTEVSASGNSSISIGPKSSSGGQNAVAIGDQASASSSRAVAYGYKSKATASNATALGAEAEANGNGGAVAVGRKAIADGGGISVGTKSHTYGYNSIAIGQYTTTWEGVDNVVAIGGGSVGEEEDTVSFGKSYVKEGDVITSPEVTRRLTHVTAGIDDTDAVNVKQLNDAIAGAGGGSGGGVYTAGNGLLLDTNTNKFSAKAGTNVTVNSDGINVEGNGVIASGNTGLISGGTLYSELRPTVSGNYITTTNSVAENLNVLDANLKQTANKTRFIGIKNSFNFSNSDGFYSYYNEFYKDHSYETASNNWYALNNADGSGAKGTNSVAIGNTANAESDFSVAIGPYSRIEVLKDDQGNLIKGTSLGGLDYDGNIIDTTYTHAAYQHQTGNGSVVIGNQAYTHAEASVVIGGEAAVGSTQINRHFMNGGTAIGYGASVSNSYGTAIGSGSDAGYKGASLGYGAAAGNGGIAIGYNALSRQKVTDESNEGAGIAIGYNARAGFGYTNYDSSNYDGGIAIGNNTNASAGVALGMDAYAGTNGVAVGNKASAANGSLNGTAIGTHSYTSPYSSSSVALGKDSTAVERNVVSFGHKANETGVDSEYKYASALTRRLVNVTKGASATDAATVAQTINLEAGSNVSLTDGETTSIGQPTKSISVLSNGRVVEGNTGIVTGGTVYDAIQTALDGVGSGGGTYTAGNGLILENSEFSVKAGTNVTVDEEGINVVGSGTVSAENTGLINGGTAYTELRPASNGNYILNANSTAQNLTALDTQVKLNSDRIGIVDTNKNYIKKSSTNDVSQNMILLDNEIKNTNTNIAGFAADITRNKENIRNLNTSVSSALSSVSSTSSLVTTLNDVKADVSLNNLSALGKQVITNAAVNAVQEYMASQYGAVANPVAPTAYNPNNLTVTNAGNGSLFVGEGSNVNGSQSIAIGVGNQVNANNSGAFGDPSVINADASYVLGNDDTINTGATGSFVVGNDSISSAKGGLTFGSNNVLEDTAENSVALGNNVNITGKNSVALGSNSTAIEDNIISVGNDTLKRKITNIANGNIADGSTEAVTGSQLFATNERIKANEDAIAQKADIDASNINVNDWSTKLGIGSVSDGNTGLVNGGTVFNAIKKIQMNNFIQQDEDTLNIGSTVGGNTISVANNAGEGRVITGVITDPTDKASATNVGYVQSLSDSIINAMNDNFVKTNTKINKVGANAAAMASLTPASFEGDEKWSLAASFGHYEGETAGAVGAFYKPTENVMMNLRGSFADGENMFGGGVAVSLSKGDVPGVTKRQLAMEVVSLKQTMIQDRQQYQQKIAQQDEQIAELKAIVQTLVNDRKNEK